jgi:hypothetical protein
MRRLHLANAARQVLLAACLMGAVTSLSAAPAWAHPRSHHRPPPFVVTTTTTVPLGSDLPAPVPPSPANVDNCVKGSWPADVSGQPASFQPGTDGAYLWYDPDGGWALRVTHTDPRGRVIFSGTITSANGTFVDVHSSGSQGNDIVAVGPGRHTVLFRFVIFGQVGGLDFATHCMSAFRVAVHVSGALAPVSQVFLGAQGANPATNPFRVERVPGTGGTTVSPGRAGAPTTGTALAATTTTAAGGSSARATIR